MNLQIQPQHPLTCTERQDIEYRPELRSRVYMAGRKDIHIFKALCLKLVARQKNTSLVWACTLMAEGLPSMQKDLLCFPFPLHHMKQVWCFKPVIPALWRWSQDDQDSQLSLVHVNSESIWDGYEKKSQVVRVLKLSGC